MARGGRVSSLRARFVDSISCDDIVAAAYSNGTRQRMTGTNQKTY